MHTKKVIGKVTETERDEIKSLIERKASLSELIKMADSESIYVYNKTNNNNQNNSDIRAAVPPPLPARGPGLNRHFFAFATFFDRDF